MKISLREPIFIIYLLLSFCLLRGQAPFIPLSVNYAVFNETGENEYVEIYLSFQQRSLTYVKHDSGFAANFNAQCEITAGEEVRFNETQGFVNFIKGPEDIASNNELHHTFFCKLPPGGYSGMVSVTDIGSGARGEYVMDMEVPSLSDTSPVLSDIEFASKITKAESKNIFYKNGLQIIPNPSGAYTVIQPMLYYYAEAYNLPFSADNPGTYTLESYITDKNGDVVRVFPEKKKQKPGNSAVLVGGHNIVTLNSDTYFFHLKFTDDQTQQTLERTESFRMFKPTKEQLELSNQFMAVTTRLMTTYYTKLSEAEMDDEFEKAKYIATTNEKGIYKNLNREGKIDFLVEFWNKRDNDEGTSQNEYKLHYFQLVDYANANFRTKFKEGWKTDRGRVLLVYGQPDEIERSPSGSGKKPYEIWNYNSLDGGSMFVFADLRGFGEYELLHSTYRKELRQPDWERQIEIQRDNNAFDFR